MVREISIDDYYKLDKPVPVIDVRSPGEFQKGHIPGAVNIALFSNDERADVGTTYVQKSKEEAIKQGYSYVTPKLDYFLKASRKVAGDGPVVLHCWRGGMRSQAFAEHLSEHGFSDVFVIKRGYKAFRNYVLQYFEQPFRLRIIGGYTGSGKTHVLKVLQERGGQVIDLEGLAKHKGSAFGSIGEKEQPTVEQFENSLFSAFHQLNIKEPIWIEDESINIGGVKMPKNLFNQIREQDVCFMNIPREERSRFLVKEYAQFGNELISEAIHKISKRLGGDNVKAALKFLDRDNYYEVAKITLHYYDKVYNRGISYRDPLKVFHLDLQSTDPIKNADLITKYFSSHEQNKAYAV